MHTVLLVAYNGMKTLVDHTRLKSYKKFDDQRPGALWRETPRTISISIFKAP